RVAVLQVTMGDRGIAQTLGHLNPDLAEGIKNGRLVQVVAHKFVKQEAVHPLHFQDRIMFSPNAYSFRQVGELDHKREFSLVEVLADCRVAFLKAGDLPGEALDGPFLAAGTAKLVYVSKVSRARYWHAERICHGFAAAQFRVIKASCRI